MGAKSKKNQLTGKCWILLSQIDQEENFTKTNSELSEILNCHPKTVSANLRKLRENNLIEVTYENVPTGFVRVVRTTKLGHCRNLLNPLTF